MQDHAAAQSPRSWAFACIYLCIAVEGLSFLRTTYMHHTNGDLRCNCSAAPSAPSSAMTTNRRVSTASDIVPNVIGIVLWWKVKVGGVWDVEGGDRDAGMHAAHMPFGRKNHDIYLLFSTTTIL